MSLELTINEAIKTAMREKDKVALDSLRAVKSQILLLKTEAKGADVSAEQEIAILQRMIKQRKDSYEQFVAQNRTDLAEVEAAQMKVIEQFLPAQLSAEELEAEIKKIIAETGAESIKDLGKVMGTASKALAGKSDGKSISEMVKKLLS
ncbi:aspartyl-tRNA amidotransferase subunit B [Cloacibacterium rupense]|uniref:Aspartyl-tRNA amidotransferase subunit B n=1 Tax=Cloacibacterium rupense TaxID=517423 RepID=A0ABQ2NHU9_9FLAO|nr:GatB/YqeY domain-containing protein [Cloacibacterium rupense]GGP03724.1 aspartyl-tRNA amidotransferase subunit B [Cloacibacterium rupense]